MRRAMIVAARTSTLDGDGGCATAISSINSSRSRRMLIGGQSQQYHNGTMAASLSSSSSSSAAGSALSALTNNDVVDDSRAAISNAFGPRLHHQDVATMGASHNNICKYNDYQQQHQQYYHRREQQKLLLPPQLHYYLLSNDAVVVQRRHMHGSSSSSPSLLSSSSILPTRQSQHEEPRLQQKLRLFSSASTSRNKSNNNATTTTTTTTNTTNKHSKSKSLLDDKTPLLNEHLIAELFNKMRSRVGSGRGEEISADTCQVRLIVDRGRLANSVSSNSKIEEEKNGTNNEVVDADDDESSADEIDTDDDNEEDEDDATSTSPAKSSSSPPSSQSSEVTTLNRAITIAHEYELDLMEVTLQVYPPVIKAVNYDKYAYEQRRKQSKAISSKKKKGGGGAISDRPTKEYKFRAGIADHDLNRKTRDMIEYLEAGHAVRVTLTARQRSLKEDGNAITTTLERVKELLGDKAVEARGMRANDRNSYGSLLFHPNTKK